MKTAPAVAARDGVLSLDRGWGVWPRTVGALKELGRRWDLDLLLLTYIFINRKLLRDVVREFGVRLRDKLLDVGCGRQQYRRFLGCQRYVGIEWNSEYRPTVAANVLRIPFRDGAFDCAVCTELLEHVPEPGQCLEEIHRVVKPGGLVLVTAPMTTHIHSESYDFYRYTRYGLCYLLNKHGFEILDFRRIGGVVSVIGARGINLTCEWLTEKLDRVLPARVRHVLLLPFSASASLLFYVLGRCLDGVEGRDAIGWAALCRTRPCEEGTGGRSA